MYCVPPHSTQTHAHLCRQLKVECQREACDRVFALSARTEKLTPSSLDPPKKRAPSAERREVIMPTLPAGKIIKGVGGNT